MLDYFTHRINPKNIKIVMTILVKNEIDILEANIRTHAKLGVNAFAIMDNGSNDGTRELLSRLAHEFDILILDEMGPYVQKKFMTKLAFAAKKRYNPDWIINNDADEFWIPNQENSLKDCLKFKGGILQIQRSNMIPPYASLVKDDVWADSKNEVRNQIQYRSSYGKDTSILLGQASRKVITNPHGLIKINTGNHSAEHIALWEKRELSSIHIYHYPIRSYNQFYKRAKTRKEVLDKDPNVKLGDHEKRWKKMFEDDTLKEEYENNFIFKPEKLQCLKDIGIVTENSTPSTTIIR